MIADKGKETMAHIQSNIITLGIVKLMLAHTCCGNHVGWGKVQLYMADNARAPAVVGLSVCVPLSELICPVLSSAASPFGRAAPAG